MIYIEHLVFYCSSKLALGSPSVNIMAESSNLCLHNLMKTIPQSRLFHERFQQSEMVVLLFFSGGGFAEVEVF